MQSTNWENSAPMRNEQSQLCRAQLAVRKLKFDGRLHQCFGPQFISQVADKKLKVVHRASIEDGLYEPEADYTKQSL